MSTNSRFPLSRAGGILLLAACLALPGCSGGGGGGAATAVGSGVGSGGGVVYEPTTNGSGTFNLALDGVPVMGTVDLDGAERGAQVELIKRTAARTVADFRVRVTLVDGTVLFTDLDIAALDAEAAATMPPASPVPGGRQPGWVWVTPVSHLASLYRERYPETPPAQALARVKSALELPLAASVNRPFVSSFRPRFSPRIFLAAARAGGGWEAFCNTLVARIHDGEIRPFREKLTGEPDLGRGDLQAQQFGEFLIGAAIGVAKAAGQTFFTWMFAKLGLGTPPGELINEINTQLLQAEAEVQVLQSDLAQLGTLTLATSLDATAATLQTFTQRERLIAVATQNSPDYQAGTPQDLPSYLAAGMASLSTQDAQRYAREILVACLGLTAQGSVVQGYNQAVALKYGSSTKPGANFYEMRNDAPTAQLDKMVEYYETLVFQAFNMLGESSHAVVADNRNTSPPADSMNLAISVVTGSGLKQAVGGNASQNGYLALVRRLVQQAPGGLLGGQSPLGRTVWGLNSASPTLGATGTANNGILYGAPGVEIRQDGTTSSYDVGDTVGNFSTAGFSGWYLPSVDEIRTLCQTHAKKAAASDGITDDTAIPYGLHKMGLLSDSNWSSTMTNVKIYCATNPGDPLGDDSLYDLVLYSTIDDSSGGNGGSYSGGRSYFRPQGSAAYDTSIVILVRPLPGQPRALPGTWIDMLVLTDPNVPAAVRNSSTATAVRAQAVPNPWAQKSDVALAAGFPPQEIVVGADPANPRQLRAYALWQVGLGGFPHDAYPRAGGLVESTYALYWDVTELVEWLSSDTGRIEVTNFRYDPDDPDDPKAGHSGYLLVHDGSQAVRITASWQTQPSTSTGTNSVNSTATFVTGTLDLAAGALPADTSTRELLLSPDNFIFRVSSVGNSTRFFLTGMRRDNRFEDRTPDCAWQVLEADGVTPVPASAAEFDTFIPGLLKFKPNGFTTTRTLVIQATLPGFAPQTATILATAP